MVNGSAASVFFNQVENFHHRAITMSNGVDRISTVSTPQIAHIVSAILNNTEYLERQINTSPHLTSRQLKLLSPIVQEIKRTFQWLNEIVGKIHAPKRSSENRPAAAISSTLNPVKVQLSMAIASQRIFTRAMEHYSTQLMRQLKLLEVDVVHIAYRDLDNCKVRAVNMVFKLKIFQKIIEYTPDLTQTVKQNLSQTTCSQLAAVQEIFKKLSKTTELDVESLDITDHAVTLKSHIEEINDKISREAQSFLKEVTDMIIADTERKNPGKGLLISPEKGTASEPQDHVVQITTVNEKESSCVVC